MIRTPRFLALIFAAVFLLGGAATAAPSARADVGVGVTPSVVSLATQAGSRQRRGLTVSNQGGEAFSATTAVVAMPGATDAESAVQWLSVDPPRLKLGAAETREVTVQVDVPAGLASGGYYAAVTITTEARTVDGADAAVAGQLEVPFLISVAGVGLVTTVAEVGRFAAVLEPDGRTGFRAEVRNTGNTHVVLRGEVELTEADGGAIDRIAFRGPTLVLPGATAILEGRSPLLLEQGRDYRVMGKLDYGARDPLAIKTAFTAEAPRVTMRDPAICVDTGGGLRIGLGIRDDGTLGIVPTIGLTVRAGGRSTPGEPIAVGLPVAWPGAVTTYSVDALGKLDDGEYELGVSVKWGTAAPIARSLPFEVGTGRDPVAPCA